ncbi:MAG: NAD(P)-dependent oxidoreductase [Desulfomicrobium sp.]|nr:NAD(P)-dependent oxidoreductase [Pseudomonadota bacterium]MBV1710524.1 NAD(P)-dependent oxidoreductase [Desulfomicrobium sp.]MBU4570132.1 NAD(P)-dependent oxidoreductase [Pseudomonadota bacterium]MBU4593052.1 NAD(P)-dependent oxidoreductase [Pseudomonadota bacterium]MBV1718861.1 NAD(P)-dependent oxidoreductase [Desulfomicrobium sp.]
MSKIGWIGIGVMGRSMCGHLLSAGHEVKVYTRTKASAESIIAAGAQWCDTPGEVARDSEFVFTIVGFPADVRSVYLDEGGLVDSAAPGTVLVDMTTSEPALAVEIHRAATARGLAALDAPVSGGDLGAKNAALAIMVGGEQEPFDRAVPLFEKMGKNIRLMGGPGAGQHTKMSNQILIAGTMVGVVESLLYAVKSGLDVDAVIDVIGSGAAGSWSINNLGRKIAKDDYDPGFFIKHFVKDMGIALAEARKMGIALPGLALVEQLYVAAMAQGLENMGTQGLFVAMKHINGMK